jgi:transposase-like protein
MILDEYQPESVKEMQEALKDLFGGMFETMLKGELNGHLGYDSNDHDEKDTSNRRNGYTSKTLNTSAGEVPIKSPRDRDGSFEPKLVPKRKKDVSEIEEKVLSMYAKRMSQRDIAQTIEEIYGFDISHETISEITDKVIEKLEDWQSRPLKKLYTFIFVDCMYVTIRKDYEAKEHAIYTILGYDLEGKKDILGLWLNDSESKHTWMKIFDEIRTRGVEDILEAVAVFLDSKTFTPRDGRVRQLMDIQEQRMELILEVSEYAKHREVFQKSQNYELDGQTEPIEPDRKRRAENISHKMEYVPTSKTLHQSQEDFVTTEVTVESYF